MAGGYRDGWESIDPRDARIAALEAEVKALEAEVKALAAAAPGEKE